MEKLKKIPSLRFSEFKGNWNNRKIKEILSIGSGRDYKNLGVGEVPVFGTGGLMTKVDSYLNDGETVCIGRKGTIDKPMYFKGKIWTVDTLFFTHSFKESDPKFVYYLFQRVNWKQHNEAGGVPSLSKSTIEQISLSLPPLPEQQKMASFLSAVDEKIQQLSRKKELLEQYKKGVMQQLFSGKLRFRDKNGEHFVDWEEKKLGDLAKITTGKLDANAMVQDGEYRFYTCAKDYFRIDKYAFDTEALLISGNGANVGYIHYYKGKFNAYQRTYVLDRIKENIIYLKFYLDNFLYERIHTEKKEGNTPYIVMSTLSEMEILLPSLPEQQKIANFLSSIDTKIESTNQHINQTQSFKKGLLQQLFV
jgi:type I restriction enzyme S subunit